MKLNVRGVLRFCGDGKPSRQSDESVHLWYRRALFPSVIDMIRNEKPIYLHWDDATGQGYVSTSTEPIGEGERQ